VRVLVTGSSGLVGSGAVEHFDALGHEVVGIDNNMRREFFGPSGDTRWNAERLRRATRSFRHLDVDIRDRETIERLFRQERFELVIHCAAQPSHDKARDIPITDFEVNALGTLYLLEATRTFSPRAVFIQMSTNKVYGDAPNELPLVELETRYDYARPEDREGIDETCRIDRCLHSLFGASKTAADVLAQEYGRYFKMPVGVFRAGCVTGASHAGVELHGFFSYLVKVGVSGDPYTVIGYGGKQVRDQIHCRDVARAFEAFAKNPRPGEVYNIGGGRANSASVLESIALVEKETGRKIDLHFVAENRMGDHICYISDLRKLRSHYPEWTIERDLGTICGELVAAERLLRKDGEAPARKA
jgi:CDP-paratose 2-epimerase